MKVDVIKAHVSRTDDGMKYAYHFEEIIRLQAHSTAVVHVFKVIISLTFSEAYPHSFGEVSRWDGSDWRSVASLGADELTMLKDFDFFHQLNDVDSMFKADRRELLRIALEVCTDIDIRQI